MEPDDPTSNLIVFITGPDSSVSASVRAQAVDGYRQAWQKVAAEHGLQPERVTAVEAYWQPSVLDQRYLAKTFGDIKVEYAFRRPAPADWAAALDEAREVFAKLAGEPEAEPGADDRGELLPVLRSGSIGGSDLLRETMPWLPVAGQDFFATFAYTARTPWDTVGMTHVLNDQIDRDEEFTGIVTTALATVQSGLMIEVTEDGGVIRMRRPDGFGAAGAVLLPDFHEQVSAIHGWDELAVSIICPDYLLVAEAASADAEQLANEVRSAGQEVPEIRPTLLKVSTGAIELVAEGGR